MLSEADLPLRLLDDRAYLDFLGPQDEPWLRVLLAEFARFEGRRRRELGERLAEPLPCDAPHYKRRAASRVLLHLWRGERPARLAATKDRQGPLPRPAALRAKLFGAAAARNASPDTTLDTVVETVVAETADHFGMTPPALRESLFADLPSERIVHGPSPLPAAAEVALRTNLAIAQAVLMRASSVELSVEGGVRPIVRLAKLRGLLCNIVDPPGAVRPTLEISGPFSLFRHTLLYGRALAELLPHLSWCARFQLHAAAAVRGRFAHVTLESGDPIFPAAAPKPFDSRLEERFARDLARLAPDWDIIREPQPIRAGASLIFPDFLLCHRLHPERRALVEIAGFWTPEYLSAKLEKLRQARLPAFVLCVDEDRACAPTDLPAGMPVIPFRRWVDAAAVMREVERLTNASSSSAA